MNYYDHAWDRSDTSVQPVGKITPITRISRKKKKRLKKGRDEKQKHQDLFEDPRKHFRELEIAIDELNEELELRDSIFRFGISLRYGQLVLLVYRKEGDATKLITGKNITKEDYIDVAMDIVDGRGLLLDLDG